MDNRQLMSILTEQQRLEQNIARVYHLFSRLFTEDADFWYALYEEEKNHAEIYGRFLRGELPLTLLSEQIVFPDLEELRKHNSMIDEALDGFLARHKKKVDAYGFALQLEELGGEARFQRAMEQDSDSEALYLIQRINREEMDHHHRIEGLRAQYVGAGRE